MIIPVGKMGRFMLYSGKSFCHSQAQIGPRGLIPSICHDDLFGNYGFLTCFIFSVYTLSVKFGSKNQQLSLQVDTGSSDLVRNLMFARCRDTCSLIYYLVGRLNVMFFPKLFANECTVV